MAVALRRSTGRANEEDGPIRGRRRTSILAEFLAALVSVLLISAAGTALFEERMTSSALTVEAHRLANSRLSVVVAAYETREETLALTLRYLAEQLNISGATEESQFAWLVSELSQTASTLDLDMLGVFNADGQFVAGDGRTLEGSAVVTGAAPGLRSRLVPTEAGVYKRVLATTIGLDGYVLLGGLDFADGSAHGLRRTLGDRGQVILIAGGKVVGSTIQLPDGELPGWDPRTRILPTQPKKVDLDGNPMLVAYKAIEGTEETAGVSAIGVAVPDPVGLLTERLTLVRFLSTVVLTGAALLMGLLLFWTLVRPIVGLSRTAARIAQGDLSATFTAPRDNEIGRLAGALQQMTGELQGKTRRLQEASKRLLVAQQDERQRMARDLHDGMQQQLVVLAVKIKQLAASEEPPNPLVLEHLAAEAEEAAFALQDLGRGIFSTVLGDQGVAAALRTSASRLPMQVRLEVAPELEERRYSPEIEGTLYFVTMEAMSNAQKHAPEAQLTIALREGPGEVILAVSDDGPGFDPAQGRVGAGLQNMADRVNAVEGSWRLTTAPGEGVRLLARIPA
ncbi:MAG: HAMP domain-containing protein [Actinomycetota bacterium]